MAVVTICPGCNKSYQLDDSTIGRRARCKCSHVFVVAPAQASSLAASIKSHGKPKETEKCDTKVLRSNTKEDTERAIAMLEQGQDEGIAFFLDLIKPEREDQGEMGRLERSLESSAYMWGVDRLKQALLLRDGFSTITYQHDWMGSPQTDRMPRPVGRIHYYARKELVRRGLAAKDSNAEAKELGRQIETESYQDVGKHIRQLATLGPVAAPAIPALVRYYEEHYSEWRYADPVIDALKAIGPAGASALRHVEAIRAQHTPGNYTVCGPCECRMERERGRGYKCPRCGRFEADSMH